MATLPPLNDQTPSIPFVAAALTALALKHEHAQEGKDGGLEGFVDQ